MHVNPFKPNILQDMQAAAQGRNLNKVWRKPKRVYPYSSERQDTRVARRLMKAQRNMPQQGV